MRRISVALMLLLIACGLMYAQETGAKYLVIAHDQFYDATLPLAAWKHKKGMRTKIVRLSEVGSTANQIRTYISNAYNNWQIRPEFLLLVGAPNYIPFPQVGVYTDNYYTDMTGDLYNEILSGRLTVHSVTETQTVINKILQYERYPEIADTSWFLRGTVIANIDGDWYDDSIYFENAHYFAQQMCANGYVEVDTFSDIFGNNANDVINSVNAGRAFVLYRGCGLNNWYSPFNCNPDQASNGNELPIVLSITCSCMGTGATPATAERWFLTGTPTAARGAAGYFSTTTVIGNGAYLRSAVAHGFADAAFIDKKKTFGEACENGRKNVYRLYGATNEYRGWTTIGDPEMNIWISSPRRASINHPAVVHMGYNEVTVSVSVNGQPEPGALVCAMQSDTVIYATGLTNSSGDALLSFIVSAMDTIFLTVTGHTLQPYEGFIMVSPEGSYVTYLSHEIVDTTGGNHNGRLNPGETAFLPVWVKNYGSDTAYATSGFLRHGGGQCIVLDSVTYFADIVPDDSALSLPPFFIQVDSLCPDLTRLDFDLSCVSSADTFLSVFSVYVHAPLLRYDNVAISGGNGNSTLEPGETANIVLRLKNSGTETAADPRAVCRVLTGNYIVFGESISVYDSIAPGGTGDNASNPFTVTADSATPIGTTVDFRALITTEFSLDTVEFRIVIGKKNYLVWNPDPSPNPGIVINSTLAALGYTGDYAVAMPADLSLYQAVFVCVGIFPNNHIIYSSSAEAAALVDFMNSGGRLYLEGGDVWYYDPMMSGYNFGPHFGIQPAADGSGDMGPVIGYSGTFTGGMNFQYGGENQFMDHINPINGGFLVLYDQDNYYNCGVAYDAGGYRTVGTSFELGALYDGGGVSTKAALLDSIMHFFGIYTGIEEASAGPGSSPVICFRTWPNPFCRNLNILFQISNAERQVNAQCQMSLKIYDAAGRMVRQWDNETMGRSDHIVWSGTDQQGRSVPAGVYFVRLETPGQTLVQKTVLAR